MSVINNLPFYVVVNDNKNNVIQSVNNQISKTFFKEFKSQENIDVLLKLE
jgi:hypothetical protein